MTLDDLAAAAEKADLQRALICTPDCTQPTHQVRVDPTTVLRLVAVPEQLVAGIKAALSIRLIAGNTDQTYTPTEVSMMVAEIADEQVRRIRAEFDA